MNMLAEKNERVTGKSEHLTFGPDQHDLRWSRFKNDEPAVMYTTVADEVFPFLRTLGGDGSTYSEHMKDARFTVPTPQLLSRVVDMLDEIPMADRDTNGDLYEYLLSKIASAGVNGQFRTPGTSSNSWSTWSRPSRPTRSVIQLAVPQAISSPQPSMCAGNILRS
jgi:type I restriction enzyme M protein